MVNSISQRLGNAAKAAGLVAILAGTSGCVAPGQRSGTNAPNMPYIVQPGFSQWNLGAGFLNLSNSAGAMGNSSGEQRSIEYKTLNYKSGDKYEGDAINTRDNLYAPHGTGKYWFTSGDVYEGQFFEGARQGRGKYTFRGGRVFDGFWEKDEFKGSQASSKD
jgi:hypothetical protein